MSHFSGTELAVMDRLLKQGTSPGRILKTINASRQRKRIKKYFHTF